jgi:hypothetical protein
MSKAEFWTLNIVGAACALLMLAGLVLGQMNERLNQSALAVQNQFNQAQQVQNTAQNLVGRVAQASQKDAALAELLARHDFKINTNSEASAQPSR